MAHGNMIIFWQLHFMYRSQIVALHIYSLNILLDKKIWYYFEIRYNNCSENKIGCEVKWAGQVQIPAYSVAFTFAQIL